MQKPTLTLIAIILFIAAIFPFVGFLGLIALYFYNKKLTEYLEFLKSEQTQEILDAQEKAKQILSEANATANDIKTQANAYYQECVNNAQSEAEKLKDSANVYYQQSIKNTQDTLSILTTRKVEIETEISKKAIYYQEVEDIKQNIASLNNSYTNQKKKLADAKFLCKNTTEVIKKYFYDSIPEENIEVLVKQIADIDQLDPTVTLKINALDYQDLRKEFLRNQKLIKQVTEKYAARYTLKTYIAIYKLMVLALSAELQNILVNLRYDKLDIALSQVKEMIEKYINIATEGNKTIAPTILSFIAEIEGLYIEAVKIEYEYYIKRERAREEQAMLREQMRQEAAERKMLEEQRKQVEKEEQKYQTEIKNINNQINDTTDNKQILLLQERLKELESQLNAVNEKKEEIINLQNGKAGYVYIISNLGSFGDKMFKIGMTRRLNPMDRVDELGDASVPFKFDVHSFIFSEDAVSLENALHGRLEKQRVNKVNIRKEFFYSDIDSLEKLVLEIDPTAEFNKTMLAEQYRQSLTIAEQEN